MNISLKRRKLPAAPDPLLIYRYHRSGGWLDVAIPLAVVLILALVFWFFA